MISDVCLSLSLCLSWPSSAGPALWTVYVHVCLCLLSDYVNVQETRLSWVLSNSFLSVQWHQVMVVNCQMTDEIEYSSILLPDELSFQDRISKIVVFLTARGINLFPLRSEKPMISFFLCEGKPVIIILISPLSLPLQPQVGIEEGWKREKIKLVWKRVSPIKHKMRIPSMGLSLENQKKKNVHWKEYYTTWIISICRWYRLF